jgi:hypothetical protein
MVNGRGPGYNHVEERRRGAPRRSPETPRPEVRAMEAPDYLICLECETPCYSFEWKNGKLAEAQCLACGNEDLDQFVTEEDFESLMSG